LHSSTADNLKAGIYPQQRGGCLYRYSPGKLGPGDIKGQLRFFEAVEKKVALYRMVLRADRWDRIVSYQKSLKVFDKGASGESRPPVEMHEGPD
jgi:hypothetical protein